MKTTLTLAVFVLFVANAVAQPALLKDINPTPKSFEGGGFISIGSHACFYTGGIGAPFTWWITDGTPTGTHSIPINEGTDLVNVKAGPGGSLIYFNVKDDKPRLMKYVPGVNEPEIVKEFSGQADYNFIRSGDEVIFMIRDLNSQTELWKSDGTGVGTVRITTLPTPMATNLAADDGDDYSYFAVADGIDNVYKLWRTDGTEAGTVLLQALSGPAFSERYTDMAVIGNTCYFGIENTGEELWKSDGTVAGTVKISDIDAQFYNTRAVALNSKILFTSGYLFATNGVDQLEKIWDNYVPWAGMYNGAYYFIGYDPSAKNFFLGTTDGTIAGTSKLFVVGDNNGSGALSGFNYSAIGKLVLPFQTYGGGYELAISDATEQGTIMVKDINQGKSGSNAQSFITVGDRLVFLADDGVHGREIWSTDGTGSGTQLVKDTDNSTNDSEFQNDSNFPTITIGEELLFTATDGEGHKFYLTNGSRETTRGIFEHENIPTWLGTMNGYEYFNLYNKFIAMNRESKEIKMVKDISNENFYGGSYFISKSSLVINNKLLFRWGLQYGTTDYGLELWVTDGTDEGTHVVKDINPGHSSGVTTDDGIVIGNKYLFTAADVDNDQELWITDGTEEGTHLFMEIAPESNFGSRPRLFFSLGGKYYFMASVPSQGYQLWTTDGTLEGTHSIVTVNKGYFQNNIAIKNNIALFEADGSELWKTDGTAEGTMMVKSFDGSINTFVEFDGKIYFTQNGELWVSDGTEDGTKKFTVEGNSFGTNISQIKPIFGSLYFASTTGFWKTSGTPETTTKLADFQPQKIAAAGDYLYLFYDSPQYGIEPFVLLRPKVAQVLAMQTATDKKMGDADFALTASSDSGLPVSFAATPSGRVSFTGNTVKILNAGHVTITASQPGNEIYSAADEVSFTICINPASPVITVKQDKFTSKVLQSSAAEGNQWFKNTTAIEDATGTTFEADADGSYTVSSAIDGCLSETSGAMAITVVGLEGEFVGAVFPNPTKDKLYIQWNGNVVSASVIDTKGNTHANISFVNNTEVNVKDSPAGFYVLRLSAGDKQVIRKFIKE